MRRAVGLIFSLMIFINGCGGDSGPESRVTNDGTRAEGPGEDAKTGGGEPQPEGTSGDGEKIAEATVTIGGETFTFRVEGFIATANCRANDSGTFRALLGLVDGAGQAIQSSDLDLKLVHGSATDGSSGENSIGIRLGHLDDGSLDFTPGWYAGAESAERTGLPPGSSQVDSYVIDGNSVSGTATFIDTESDSAFFRGDIHSVEPVKGTFSVNCGS